MLVLSNAVHIHPVEWISVCVAGGLAYTSGIKLNTLTVMALPWSLWFFNLCSALYASCRRFIQIKAQPLGGIRSMDTMSPYSPNVSDSSSWCTNFDRCPTQSVVLHTERWNYILLQDHLQLKKAQQLPSILGCQVVKLYWPGTWHKHLKLSWYIYI